MRLDKYLSEMGVGTRTEIKKACKAGLVMVDGIAVKDSGLKIDENTASVTYRGVPVAYEEFVYYMMHKPAGVISASDDNREPTVVDLIDEQKRKDLFPVGRLDRDTEGLLMITNDGELAHRLLSPKHHVDKLYYAKVLGICTDADVVAFREGLTIDGGLECMPADLKILETYHSVGDEEEEDEDNYQDMKASDETGIDVEQEELPILDDQSMYDAAFNAVYDPTGLGISEIEITIREGKFHQVKRMFQAVGKEVLYLKRLSMGPLELDPELEPGEYRRLTDEEVKMLKAL